MRSWSVRDRHADCAHRYVLGEYSGFTISDVFKYEQTRQSVDWPDRFCAAPRVRDDQTG